MLGAGNDSRAYCFDALKDGRWTFAVGHPARQAIKTARLRDMSPEPPEHVTDVPLDQGGDSLGAVPSANGLANGLKPLVIWEGVTMDVDRPAVDAMLRFISNHSGPESAVDAAAGMPGEHWRIAVSMTSPASATLTSTPPIAPGTARADRPRRFF